MFLHNFSLISVEWNSIKSGSDCEQKQKCRWSAVGLTFAVGRCDKNAVNRFKCHLCNKITNKKRILIKTHSIDKFSFPAFVSKQNAAKHFFSVDVVVYRASTPKRTFFFSSFSSHFHVTENVIITFLFCFALTTFEREK